MICLEPATRGRPHYSPHSNTWRQPLKNGLDGLSKRELEIAKRYATGMLSKDIAAEFGISKKTVSTHRGRIKRKLGIADNVTMTHFLLARGVVRNLYADEPNG